MFKLKEKNAKFFTEVFSGFATFFTMAYVLVLAPKYLADADPKLLNPAFVATCLAAFFGSTLMGLMANLPFAQAPALGLSAFFANTLMLKLGYTYPQALVVTFVSGLLFVIVTAIGLRESITKSMPKNLRIAMAAGIGLYIVLTGLNQSGLVDTGADRAAGLVDFRGIFAPSTKEGVYLAIMTLLALVIIGMLYRFKVPGSVFLGIVAASAIYWAIGVPTGLIKLPEVNYNWNEAAKMIGNWASNSFGVVLTKGFPSLFAGKDFLDGLIAVGMLVISFTFVDLFDSVGVLTGTATKAEMLDGENNMPGIKRAMFADSISTSVGALLGAPVVSISAESSAGAVLGGKTGLSSCITGLLFLAAIAAAPFLAYVPAAATGAALIFVGILMISAMKDYDWGNITDILPGLLAIVIIPFGNSIADGIFIGVIAHVLIKLVTFKLKDISILDVIMALLFIAKYLFIMPA